MEVMLSIDPGKTTGYCLAVYTTKLYVAPDEGPLTLSRIDYMLTILSKECHPSLPFHVIYEDFTYRNYARLGLDLTPVKVIGVIELHAEQQRIFESFDKQSAAAGKGHYTDDKLKELGLYKVGKSHGRDATRHLLQWINFGAGGQYIKEPVLNIARYMVSVEEMLVKLDIQELW